MRPVDDHLLLRPTSVAPLADGGVTKGLAYVKSATAQPGYALTVASMVYLLPRLWRNRQVGRPVAGLLIWGRCPSLIQRPPDPLSTRY